MHLEGGKILFSDGYRITTEERTSLQYEGNQQLQSRYYGTLLNQLNNYT